MTTKRSHRRGSIPGITALTLLFLFAMTSTALAMGGNITWEPEGAAPAFFSHEVHVKSYNIRCIECHLTPFQMMKTYDGRNSMAKMQKGGGCGKCHNGTRAFDVVNPDHCRRCHR